MAIARTAFLLVLGFSFAAAQAAGALQIDRYQGTLYVQGGKPKIAELIEAPSFNDVLAALPAGAKSAVRTQWVCDVQEDGRLTGCTMTTSWPDDRVLGDATRPLLAKFQLSPTSVDWAQQNHARLIIEVDLYGRGLTTATLTGCPPPFCVPVIPPPPPFKPGY